MGKTYDVLDERLTEFLERQPVFFVGTAPLSAEGHVNVSPKGLDSFRVLGPRQVAYLDLIGSGAETLAHIRENGRIVLMFCAFEGAPKIVRLHGRGSAVVPGDPGWAELAGRFPAYSGPRSIVRVDVSRISDSCGFGVPELRAVKPRDHLEAWAKKQGADALATYQRTRNAASIDGLPALPLRPVDDH